jgi:hypothetical protein
MAATERPRMRHEDHIVRLLADVVVDRAKRPRREGTSRCACSNDIVNNGHAVLAMSVSGVVTHGHARSGTEHRHRLLMR